MSSLVSGQRGCCDRAPGCVYKCTRVALREQAGLAPRARSCCRFLDGEGQPAKEVQGGACAGGLGKLTQGPGAQLTPFGSGTSMAPSWDRWEVLAQLSNTEPGGTRVMTGSGA